MKLFEDVVRVLDCLNRIDATAMNFYGRPLRSVVPVKISEQLDDLRTIRKDLAVALLTARGEVAALHSALKPFAMAHDEWKGIGADHMTLRQAYDETPGEPDAHPITVAHLKQAAEVLKCS